MQLLNLALVTLALIASIVSINNDMRKHNAVIEKIEKLSELDQMTLAMENKIPIFNYQACFFRLFIIAVCIVWLIIKAIFVYKTGSLG
jgi:hypothetical protein